MKIRNRMVMGSVFIMMLTLFVMPRLSWGADPPAPKWYDTVTVSGFVDGYYSYNLNGPQNQTNLYHNFDFRSNDFNVSLVELNFVKPVDDKNKAGFYIGLAFGEAADAVACGACASPVVLGFTTPPAESPYKNFRQAYASLLLTPSLQLDFGKFVTQHGSEVIESKDNWNYTRSLLFSWSIPYYHSGARLIYTLNDKVTLMGNITNGMNNVVETNNGKTYGVQLAVTPLKTLPIVINYMTGPELNVGVSDTQSLLDVVATWNISDALSLMANYDSGAQKQASGAGTGDAKWSGFAVYGRYAFTGSYAAAIRVEQFDDTNGFRTAFAGGQKLTEGTVTLEKAASGGSLIRVDIRQDKSDKKPFTKEDGTATDSQMTVTLGLVQTF